MTLSEEARARIAEERRLTATVRARWKELTPGNYGLAPQQRAICGKASCPGSLGIFEAVLAHPNDAARLLASNVEIAGQCLSAVMGTIECDERIFGRTDLAPDLVAKRRAILDELRPLHRNLLRLARANLKVSEEEQRRFEGGDDYLASRPAFVSKHGKHFWMMQPEAGHGEPGSRGEHRSQPIYFGHRSSAFRISTRGKRTPDGERVSRRPFRRDVQAENRVALGEWAAEWNVTGQNVMPPCLIVCAVCETINYVSLPDGMGVLIPGTDEPIYLAP